MVESREVTEVLVALKPLQTIFWVEPFDRASGRVEPTELWVLWTQALCSLWAG